MESYLQTLLEGAKINWLKRTCDLIMLDLTLIDGRNISLHLLCFMRIFNDDKLIVSSWDMYRKGENSKKRFKYDCPYSTMYDDEIKSNSEKICDISIKLVVLNNKDLVFTLENGIRIEILNDTVASEENESEEVYRIFDTNKDYFVVNS